MEKTIVGKITTPTKLTESLTPYLRVQTPNNHSYRYPLSREKITIGRDKQCNIVLDDQMVSREHCRVWLNDSGFAIVQDLNSTNGTKIDSKQINQEVLLPQNRLKLGNHIIKVEFKDAEEIKTYTNGDLPLISPDGKRIGYGVRFDNPDLNDGYGRDTDTHEIQISNLDGTNTIAIQLPEPKSDIFNISWFPNGKFIALTAQVDVYTLPNLYIVKSDGSAMSNITPDGFNAGGYFYWSRDGQKLLHWRGNIEQASTINGYWIASFSE